MPHKILVTASVEHEGLGADYLQPHEFVRGEPSKVSLTVTNLADDFFPGGSINGIQFGWGESGRATTSFDDVLEIGRLEHLSEAKLELIDVLPITDGQVWLQLRVQATDLQPVECFQAPDETSIDSDRWRGPLYAVNREHLQIISLLNRLLNSKEG